MRLTLPLIVILFLGGCVTANVDEMTFDAPIAGIGEGSVVILWASTRT